MVLPARTEYVLYVNDCNRYRYEWEWFDNRSDLSDADVVTGVGADDIDVGDIALRTDAEIRGRVTNVYGYPLGGIRVRTFDWSGFRNYWYTTTSWSDGSYTLPGQRGGAPMRVQFYDPDGGFHDQWYDGKPAFAGADAVTVVAGYYIDGIDAAMYSMWFGSFRDDEDSVFEADIEWLAAAGITKGCNPPINDLYCPKSHVTRGQMAAFLVRALHLTGSLDNPFTDDDTSIFEADIEKLASAGITKGCNPPINDQFCPHGYVTRGQMAAFLVRAMGYTAGDGADRFVDDDGSIFEHAIDKLATAGVTQGCNPPVNDRFCPHGYVTRGQMAAFLHRALG